jgi:hypothetical protein
MPGFLKGIMKATNIKILNFTGTANGSPSVLNADPSQFKGKRIRIHSIKANFFTPAQATIYANSATVDGIPTNFNVIPANSLISKVSNSPFDYSLTGNIFLMINGNSILFSGIRVFTPNMLDYENLFLEYDEAVNSIVWSMTFNIMTQYGITPLAPKYSIDMLIEVL